MAVIQITKKFVSSKYPNIVFEVGEMYDAAMPLSGTVVSGIVERELPSSKPTTTETIQTVKIEVPKEYFIIFTGRPSFVPTDDTGYQGETVISATPEKDKNVKYIVLGIFLIGAVSYLLIKNKK